MFFSGIALGIIFTLIGIVIFIAIFILKRRTSVKISKNLLGIDRITERDLAKISNVFIEDVHTFLHDVSRNPETSGIAILVRGQYIYFSNRVIKRFKELFKSGKTMKEIVAELVEIETKEEYKRIVEKLREFDELPERPKNKLKY
ncbi:MAG: hypothetical protein ACTSYS_01085 [Promethearchaeota archaeon]